MTIPTRPAPAPPVVRGQSAADGANANIEQLRRQLEQQQQHQNVTVQKLTIKLPPPPKGAANGLSNGGSHNISNNNNSNNTNGSSITRKFPKARYAPATNWDDSPFDTVSMNGNFKKVPPPRPPPPKVQVNGRKASAPVAPAATQSSSLLNNIFHRKKQTNKAVASAATATRVYGVSSGNYNSTSVTTTQIAASSYIATGNWNAAWGSDIQSSTSLSSLNGTHATAAAPEGQLISFDSPPSSPTFTQKSNSDCVSVDSFSSDSNFSSPNNGSVSQPESGFEDDFSSARSRPATTSPLDPWETLDALGSSDYAAAPFSTQSAIGTAPVRNMTTANSRLFAGHDNPLCNGKSLLPPAPSLVAPTIIKPKISQKPKAPKPPGFAKPYSSVGASAMGSEPSTPPSPPMPQCAPPPPPAGATAGAGVSLLDVITGKVDAIHLSGGAVYAAEEAVPYGVALYDFEGLEEGDLCFRENEKVYLLEQVSDEWYRGRTRAGCEGIFPINYVEIKVPLSTVSDTTSSAESTPTFKQQSAGLFGSSYPSSNYTATKVRSLYNFPAEVEGDLALKEHDLVTILYRINEDWLFGEIAGRQGQFPANFLEYVPDNIPLP